MNQVPLPPHILESLAGSQDGVKPLKGFSGLGGQSHVKHGSADALARKYMLHELAIPEEKPNAAMKGATVPSAMIATEKPMHRFVIYLNSLGMKPEKIGELTDYTPEHVRTILAQPWARKQATRLIEESDPAMMIPQMLANAAAGSIQTLIEIRDDPKQPAASRVNSAKDLLDRFLGKPVQMMKMELPKPEATNDDEIDQQLKALQAREKDLVGRPRVREVTTPDLHVVNENEQKSA